MTEGRRGPKRLLSPRFDRALAYAARLHARQKRKGTDRPYIGHLLAVTAIVFQYGGDEEEAIAALLHDAVEDQGGHKTLREIRQRFGPRVARIVEGCTDAYSIPKPPWRERKEQYISRLREAPADVRRVAAADKLANAREILADVRALGDRVWDRFTAGRQDTLWYYREVVNILADAGGDSLTEELKRVVAELQTLGATGS